MMPRRWMPSEDVAVRLADALDGAGYGVVFAGRALREMFRPPFEIKDSAVQVAGEGVGALGGATAAHQSFWDNGPQS